MVYLTCLNCPSEHKKDPGIPNEFPYKDQVLAEVQEQRRQVRTILHCLNPGLTCHIGRGGKGTSQGIQESIQNGRTV